MKAIRKVLKSIRGISTPIGGINWEPEGIDVKLVDSKYPSSSRYNEREGVDSRPR